MAQGEIEQQLEHLVTNLKDTMPERFHTSGRLEVEINRAFIDHLQTQGDLPENEVKRQSTLMSKIMQRHGIAVTQPAPPATPKPSVTTTPLLPDEQADEVRRLVASAFEGTFDGSKGFADHAAKRARAWVKYSMADWNLSFFARRALKKIAEDEIATCRKDVIF